MNPFPCLRVENLIVRTIQASDVNKMVQYFQENRAYLASWEPIRDDSFFTIEEWKKKIIQFTELQRYGLSYYFLIFEEGKDKVAGVITYNNIIHYPSHSCQLGYSLAKKAQGKGIMRRALKESTMWLCDDLNMHRIMASYMPKNKRSGAVLKSLGFTCVGKVKGYLLINGKWEDHLIASFINPRWKRLEK